MEVSAKLYKDGFLIDEAVNIKTAELETLNLNSNTGANQLFITGYETLVDEVRINVVPIPPTVWLIGFGLVCLAGLRKRLMG